MSTYPPPPPPNSSKIAITIIGVVVAVVIIIGIFIVALPMLNNAGNQIVQTVNPPNAYVTSKNCRTGTSGLDYVAYVDVSVHNSGGDGTVVVWAKVVQGSNQWTKSVSIYMSSQESRDVTLTFSEVGLFTFNNIQYSVWIE